MNRMKKPSRSSVALTIAAAVVLGGCGGADGKSAGTHRTASSSQDQRAAIIATLHSYVDEDRCDLETDRYAGEGASSAEQGRRACARDRAKGLQAGDYTIERVTVGGDRANARLKVFGGSGYRDYTLVNTKGRWLIDGKTDHFVAHVGQSLPLFDEYTSDGSPVIVDLRITLKRLDNHPAPPPYLSPGAGKRYVRALFRVRSRSPTTYREQPDVSLVDAGGHRYTPTADYRPSLGNMIVTLGKGETEEGYLTFQVPRSARLKSIRWESFYADPLVWRVA